VDDNQSIRAIQRALDLGVNFFDTADVYGAGHSERILGKTLVGHRTEVIVATKFGNLFDEKTRQAEGHKYSRQYIYEACEASLRRLSTDYIDLYQFHLADVPSEEGAVVRDILEELVREGKIRFYGWSTDDPERAAVFSRGEHCVAVQHHMNLFDDNESMIALCEEQNLASVNRGPLAMGLLTGKFTPNTKFPKNDVRRDWDLESGRLADRLKHLDALREVLTQDGRTSPQAALGWLWARSERTIPIPGIKTVAQIEENATAMDFGPLSSDQMDEIRQLLSRNG
jgi:aryl-alcohol dehydrogenase-like predicted oxidoreductase